MAFTQKLIDITVELAANSQTNQPNVFAGTSSNSVTLSGSRTSVRIQNAGAPVNQTAEVKIWGIAPSLMNELSTLGLVYDIVPRNILTIKAGDTATGMPTVFSGTIWGAYGDYSSQPDVPFVFFCNQAGYEAAAPGATSSFTGPTDVAAIMSGLARKMNFGFENNGVSVILRSSGGGGPTYRGSYWLQAFQAARDARIQWGIVNGQSGGLVLAIWPNGKSRATANPPLISPGTGMIDYPAFTQNGIIVKTLFNPLISYGGLVKIQSSLLSGVLSAQKAQNPAFNLPASSTWAVNKVDLALDSLVPHGEWMSMVNAWNPNYPQPIPAAP
jgi:hypothetical protein